MTTHQLKQIEVIDHIEEQVKTNSADFSMVAPVDDYENDNRLCLTSAHFPKSHIIAAAEDIIDSLKEIEPSYYYYPADSLHMTIKNVREICNPPRFTEEDIKKAEKVFSKVIPQCKKFQVYFYRLLLFKNSVSLIGTTDPELDTIILELDKRLKKAGLPDDKKYSNSRHFFSAMTLARFPDTSNAFRKKVTELSSTLSFTPYTVDTISLVACNGAFKKRKIINTWELQ